MFYKLDDDVSAYGQFAPRGLTAQLIAWTRACAPSWAGKRRAFLLRGFALRAMKGRPLDVEAYGARMRLYPYNNTCEKRILFTPQYFDEDERALIASRIDRPDFTFIDAGASVGGYALAVAAQAGPRARILAIEPLPEIFRRLVYNIRQNPFATIKALDCAVADRDGEITLFVAERNRGETSMRMVNADLGGESVRVPARSLKNIVLQEGYERIDAMKLDCEGASDVILEPFFREAPKALWPKLLIMERLQGLSAVDLERILRERGYRAILETRSNIAYERD